MYIRITIGGATSSKTRSVGERFVKVYNYNADEFEKAEEKILDSPLECTGFGKNTFYGSVDVKIQVSCISHIHMMMGLRYMWMESRQKKFALVEAIWVSGYMRAVTI